MSGSLATNITTVFIASDHAGYSLKTALLRLMPELPWKDLGTNDSTTSVDYPRFASALSTSVGAGSNSLGVLICGSGVGVSIGANKLPGIRAALVTNPVIARLAREHNHANVLCLGARFTAPEYAVEIIRAWLEATPSPDPRHGRRVHQLSELEKGPLK